MIKLAYFLRKMKTLRVNNTKIPEIENAKFSLYCIFINLNIYGDFQICISVPLTLQWQGVGGGDISLLPPCGFSKRVGSRERVEPWSFVTFNIVIRHIFPENFIEIAQVV